MTTGGIAMFNVCISTFCVWNSYGSMLQAYGLQYALAQMGCRGFVASAKQAPEETWTFPGFRRKNPKAILVDAHQLLISHRIRRRFLAANRFIADHIAIEYFGTPEALRQSPPEADAYLSGSDQVWNPIKLDPVFFLDFIPEGYPRISYAASMGITRVPEEKQPEFQRLVGSFDHISLREQDMLPVIGTCTDRPAQVHIDPVFLVPEEHWRQLAKPYPIAEPYILVYPIYWDKKLNRQLKQLHKKTGKTIVAVLGQAQQVYANRRIYDASPEQFLWLVDHADAVVSSSFHGIAMSLVLGKPFSAVMDPRSSSRLQCLLQTLGVRNTGICELAEKRQDGPDALDSRILAERQKSMDYLRKVLSFT